MATIHQLKSFSNNAKKKSRIQLKKWGKSGKREKVMRKKESRKLKQNKQLTHPQRHQAILHRENR